MDKLFVPFDRLDVSRNRNIEGTGLGLSISRQLLHLMHTELMVESIYGQGSRFYFSIWQGLSDKTEIGGFKPEVISKTVRNNEGERRFFTAPGGRILVVDDMPMNLQVLKGLLKRSEMIIETASSGRECIQRFGEQDFDIVFMDYRMPEMNGIETLHKLKEMYPKKVSCTTIIALTASAILGDKERLLNEGFNDYLSKPVNINEMEEMLTRYIGGSIREATPEVHEEKEANRDIPGEILDMDELDCKRGLEYCGDVDDYLFALKTYSESVDEKALNLEESLDKNRIEDFTLIAHSLKSMSNSIGALGLGKRAEALEHAGREGKMDILKKDAADFVRDYRTVGEKLRNAKCLDEIE